MSSTDKTVIEEIQERHDRTAAHADKDRQTLLNILAEIAALNIYQFSNYKPVLSNYRFVDTDELQAILKRTGNT